MVILEEVSSAVSCSSTPQWKYHVFLSFRGTDTRYNFTGHLYNALIQKGINTYMDDPELPKGEEISSELLQAIQDSKVSIIVFSENYASSSWCLDELVKILNCKKSNKQMVHPIFYKVEPSDIRHLKGSFGEALAKHECRFKDNLEKVQEWKNALSEAANLSGWTLPITKNQSESKLIMEIVEEISKQLISRTYLDVGNHSVGIEHQVEAVKNLLGNLKGKDVRMVGIWGTGGIGKTTLAKAVYNSIAHQFEGCCFLENVRENSKCNRNLVKLQKKLLSGLLVGTETLNFSNSAQGITMIKERLQYKSVLLVLDDVSDIVQLRNLAGESDWFGMGSRIVINTRDMKLLRAHNVGLIYEVDALNHHDSLELFSLCAFHEKTPIDDYVEFTERAIISAQGLPLALTVLGSYLYGVDKDEWEATLNGLKSHPDIQKILKVSYDALDAHVKEAFLDIACFLNGESTKYVMEVLKGCHNDRTEYIIDVLTEKALIRIHPFYGVRMHDLLEEMGKDIVHQQSPNDPGERSRLWFHDDVYHVLTENSGTRKIIGIKMELPKDSDEIYLTVGTFSNMLNLRLFICRAGSFSGVLDYLPGSLRVLDWPNCPFHYLPSNFNPKNLALLNMPKSRIIEIGKTWKILTNLTSMDFSECKYLTKVSDLSRVPNLQSLDLGFCTNLVEVDRSVGRLDRLRLFNLHGCFRLTNFPTSVTWKSLTHLFLDNCTRLEIFIEFVNKMESIANLDLRNTGIKELPSWIGYLPSLVALDLSGTLVKELPSSIGNLTSLEELNLSRTPVNELPSSIGNFTSLVYLDASQTLIKDLPISIGNLIGLKELYLQECENLANVPDSVYGGLQLLETLDLSWCPKLVTSPTNPDTCNSASSLFPQLRHLRFKGCNLVSVSDFLSNLDCTFTLWELDFSGSSFDSLPACITKFWGLNSLNLSDCKWLRDITELPPITRIVDLRGCVALERFSSFSNILERRGNRLFEEMDLSGCYRLVENLGIDDLVSKFENAYRNHLDDNGTDVWEYSVKFPILCGSEVPEWFDKHVLPDQNTCEIVIEIPPSLKWEKTGLAVCLVYETDPNIIFRIEAMPRENGIEINIRLIEKKNVANETEWSKDHDHVWLAWFMDYDYRVRFSSEILSGDVMRIKSCGVHLINLPEDIYEEEEEGDFYIDDDYQYNEEEEDDDIYIDDDYHYNEEEEKEELEEELGKFDYHNAEDAATTSELSDAAIDTKQGLQLVLYDDHPNKRISHQARSSISTLRRSSK